MLARVAPRCVLVCVLFPFVHAGRRGVASHSRFFPFFLEWSDESNDTRQLHVLWPLARYARQGDRESFRLFFPYTTYEAGKDHSDFRIFWKWIRVSHDPSFSTLVVNPFYRQEANARGDTYWSVLGGLFGRKVEAGAAAWRLLWLIWL